MLFSAFTAFLLPFHSPDRLVLRLQCHWYSILENVECCPGFTIYNVLLHPSSRELANPPRSAFSVIGTAPLCAVHPITSPRLILSASTPLVAPNTYCAPVTGALLNLPTHLPPRMVLPSQSNIGSHRPIDTAHVYALF
ncbi:hypothetical protein B0H13DRAFT_2379842 [Mycena leptocephala]|nr:hypothetical protein B0H13DRAFT_2379842 [Mycena leptocephala]